MTLLKGRSRKAGTSTMSSIIRCPSTRYTAIKTYVHKVAHKVRRMDKKTFISKRGPMVNPED